LVPFTTATILGLLFSLSRGGTLGFAAGLILLVLLWGRARIMVSIVAAIAVGLTIFGANPLIGTEDVQTIEQRLSSAGDFGASRTNLRPRAYSEAIELTAENPLFGIGVNQFRAEVATRGPHLSELGRPLEDAHNVVLSLSAETGLIGVGGFLFWCALLFGRTRAAVRWHNPLTRPLALGFAAALFGFAIQGMTVTQNRNHLLWGTFLVIAGMTFALGDRADREHSSAKAPIPSST
jgi:O-antigen ligase